MINENFDANKGFLPDDEAKERVRQYLEMILAQCYQMGNNDSEREKIQGIGGKFGAGMISEEEAKKQANSILANKHDH
jgi:hypothetical protein